MAPDPRAHDDTNELPAPLDAFSLAEPEQQEPTSAAVSRAATLLTLVPPRVSAEAQDELAEREAIERLGIRPLRPFQIEKLEFESVLESGSGRFFETALALARQRRVGETRKEAQGFAARMRFIPSTRGELDPIEDMQRDASQELFASRLGQGPGRDTSSAARVAATRLVVASMFDRDLLVRIAAAGVTLRFDETNPVAEGILEDASAAASDELAEFARVALASFRRHLHRRIEIEDFRDGVYPPKPDAALIHGTWARRGDWWQPGNGLHRFLRDERVFPELYSGPESFKWSGYFDFRTWSRLAARDWNREAAGQSLAWWAQSRLVHPPHFIGHSYGASISMLATNAGKRVRGLVLLSPAVHRTCLPDPANYGGAFVVRMPLDLVLLFDRSKISLLQSLPNITELVLPRQGLTGHSATHDPEIWRVNDLHLVVRDQWLPTLP
jgi:pimeloyl-ACP methyl ester carboxylesterase